MKTLFISIILFVNCLQAQSNKLRFTHLGVNNGLSQNMINAIEQDSIGFMWFGTKDGLNRYDGYHFDVFRYDNRDTNSLSDSYITSLFIDSNGKLWVGTRTGLNLFDTNEERFIKVVPAETETDNYELNQIASITEDKYGAIWAASKDGRLIKLDHISKTKNSKICSSNIYRILPTLQSSKLLSFTIDSNGDLWIGFNEGLWKAKIDRLTSKFSWEKISDITARSLFAYQNNIWCGSDGVLFSYNVNSPLKESAKINLFGTDPKYRTWLFAINSIIQKDESSLFIATSHGLVEYNFIDNNSMPIIEEQKKIFTISSNNLTSVFIDRSKNLWVGTAGYGINKSNLFTNNFEYYPASYGDLSTQSILLIKEDIDGTIWFTNMGSILFKLDKETGTSEIFNSSTNVTGIYYDLYHIEDNSVWLLKSATLQKLNPDKKTVGIYNSPTKNNIKISFERIITVDSNLVWIATNNAIVSFNETTKKFSVYSYPFSGEHNIFSVYAENSYDFWIGTEKGLLRFNRENNKWNIYKNGKDGLSNERVKSMCYDPLYPNKYIWLGTDGGGLNRLNLETSHFDIFTTDDGLPNNVIYGILSDDQNNLWISTNKGLSRFNPYDKKVRNYNIYDGLQDNEFNSLAYLKGNDGKFYFGGINGITSFYPDKMKLNNQPPEIFITSFKIFNKEVTHRQKDSPLNKIIGVTDEIILPYDQNNLSFSFTALDFTVPQNNEFKYILDGFDKDWIDNNKSREAYYTNLSSGSYTFKVIGSNNDEVWNKIGASVKIKIAAPYWATWWAYLLYIMLITLIMYLIIHSQKRRLLLVKKNEINKIEKEKLLELNKLKTRFLTNVTHEFRTPLTLVIGPIEELILRIKDKENIKSLRLVKENAKHLLGLVNQLLELSRLEKEALPIKISKDDLVQFIHKNIAMIQSLAERKGIIVNFRTYQKYINANFDSEILQKIFSNLLSNSIKYTPNSGMINISLRIIDTKTGVVEIIVQDNGIGIPSHEVKNIYNPFFRTSKSKFFNSDGYGIGLSLTKELVDLLGGSIITESEPGVRTSFYVNIPMKIDSYLNEEILFKFVPEKSPEIEETLKIIKEDVTIDDKIVLIIDDIKEMQNYIAGIIEEDYKVIRANNGIEGFTKARESIPDLIISDVMMPKLSGFEFLNKLRNEIVTSHIPVIFLTAKADEQSKLNGLEIGADDYMVKPFSAMELKTRIKNLITSREKLKAKYQSYNIQNDKKPKSRDEIFLEKVYSFINSNISKEDLSVEELAKEIGLSYSQVYRKIKSLTKMTTIELVQRCRVNKASELLEAKAGNISEISYMVGFNNPSYFTQCFKKEFHCTPKEYFENIKEN